MIARKDAMPTPEPPDDPGKKKAKGRKAKGALAPSPGGTGEAITGELMSPAAEVKNRADLRLLNRAIRLRWPTGKRVRRKVIDTLERIITNPDDQKMAISACKVFVQADSVNVAIAKMESEVEVSENVADRPRVVIILPHNGRDAVPSLEGGK